MATDHDHPKAAPDELDHIRQFVNTLDLETHEERFGDPAALHGWLAERNLIPDGDTLSDADVRQAKLMREALRKLLLAHNGAELDPDAVDCVNSAAKSAELVVRFHEDGNAALTPVRPGVDGGRGRLTAIVYRSMAGGTWERIRACRDDNCEWAFYDWSK